MGKQNREDAALQSSIALLQERFRQLQRVKELREEREQIKCSTDDDVWKSPSQAVTSKWFIHPDLIYPSGPLSGGSSSIFNEIPSSETPFSMQRRAAAVQISSACGDGDLDTSLHL